jgi:hypothetical protein
MACNGDRLPVLIAGVVEECLINAFGCAELLA